MKKLFVFCSVFLSLLCINNAYAAILTLEGPSLDIESSGWGETGIQITALQDVTLVSFDFLSAYPHTDTFKLTNATQTIDIRSLPDIYCPSGNLEITVNWALTAGNTYNLISTNTGAGWWTSVPTGYFPVANDHIQVNGTWGGVKGYPHFLTTSYWFHFKDLKTTDSPVPIPPSVWLLGSGLIGLVGLRRKFFRK